MTGIYTSALDMFSIGIGPSSSHTVGPMRAGAAFIADLRSSGLLAGCDRIQVRLHGSLAATGIGHGTPDAALAGLLGLEPETCDPGAVHGLWAGLRAGGLLQVGPVIMTGDDVTLDHGTHDFGHPNALTFTASSGEAVVRADTYLSVGGGFIVKADNHAPHTDARLVGTPGVVSTYRSAGELMAECATGRTIAEIAMADELALRGEEETFAGLDRIWAVMDDCIDAGMRTTGTLPGGLKVPRRASTAALELNHREQPVSYSEWLAVWALAVNEQNAAGDRVVTAPTNGAAGVVPASIRHLVTVEHAGAPEIRCFLLTAAAIGSIIKANASISGAEAGCQGEIGSACAMAAAGMTAVLGGSPSQVENAAEIAMEHHLGLTCDPVSGLVQIPCIERNAMAAAAALTATRLALLGDGRHLVSLDTVIETMRQTGADMSVRYKETSLAGLAVNVVEC